jgi:drug/metabolite transporter (DMT)-like permease
MAGIIIGLSPIFVRLSEVGPVTTGFWRVAIALLPLLAWRLAGSNADGRADRPQSLRDAFALLFPGVMLAGDLVAWHLSIHLTSVANATLLANMAPIFVTFGGWVLFRSRVTRGFLVGLALALTGVVILNSRGASAHGHLAGDAIAIVAAMFYAGYMLSLSRLRLRYSTMTIMVWSTFSAAVCMLPIALAFETGFWPLTLSAWAVVLGLAWLCHLGGQGLITYALAWLPASFSSLTLLIQPVVAAFVAWLVLHEPLGALQATGGAIILLGILVARRS